MGKYAGYLEHTEQIVEIPYWHSTSSPLKEEEVEEEKEEDVTAKEVENVEPMTTVNRKYSTEELSEKEIANSVKFLGCGKKGGEGTQKKNVLRKGRERERERERDDAYLKALR